MAEEQEQQKYQCQKKRQPVPKRQGGSDGSTAVNNSSARKLMFQKDAERGMEKESPNGNPW